MRKLVISFIAAAAGLLIARYYVSGFVLPYDWKIIGEVALALAILNITIRPFLTFIFKPFIIITLGIFYFVIAALLLWFVDYFFASISFATLTDLVYASIILSLANSIVNAFIK